MENHKKHKEDCMNKGIIKGVPKGFTEKRHDDLQKAIEEQKSEIVQAKKKPQYKKPYVSR